MPELRTLYGPMQVPDNPDDLIRRFLAYYGEWASIESHFVAQLIEPGARVLDLGAFLGTFSLGLARCADISFVCAVEGNEAVSALTATNLARNLGVEFNLVSAVVVGSPGPRVKRQNDANLGATNFVGQQNGTSEATGLQPIVVLSDVIAENGPFDLIKMDVEGMELELLRSVDLELSDATLWIECNDRPASIDVCRLLLQRGYDVTYFAFPSHNPDNFNHQEKPIFPYAYEAGLVASRRTFRDLRTFDDVGCFSRPIATAQDLVEALWVTPRWCPPGWENLSKAELVAAGSRSLLARPGQNVAPAEQHLEPPDLVSVASRMSAELRLTQAELRRTRQMLAAGDEPEESVSALVPQKQVEETVLVASNPSETQQRLAAMEAELATISNSRSVRVVRKVARVVAKVPGATRAARVITRMIDRALR